jgi:AcrR family transcriptional regulator
VPRQRFHKLSSEKRATILTAAANAFAEHGYEKASQNRIIAEAGISKGAFYYYFDDKEDLYTTVLTSALERLIESVGPPQEVASVEEYWQQCHRIYRRSLHFWQEEPTTAALVRRLDRGDGPSIKAFANLRQLTDGFWRQFVVLGQRVGAVTLDLPVDLLVRILDGTTAATDVWVAERVDELAPERLDELADKLVNMLRRMSTTEPETEGTA